MKGMVYSQSDFVVLFCFGGFLIFFHGIFCFIFLYETIEGNIHLEHFY